MVIAGLVIETMPAQAAAVADRLRNVKNLEVKAEDGSRRLAAVWRGERGEDLEELSERLVESDEAVLGVFPTFVGCDDA